MTGVAFHASVQTSAESGPFLPYAVAVISFVGGFWLLCFLLVAVPRIIRSHIAAKHVINEAEAFVRQAERAAK